MAQLYRAKWEINEGEIFKRDNRGKAISEYTDGFILWAKKTEHLTNQQWARGFEIIEAEVKAYEHNPTLDQHGNRKELWPPSYAEFVAKCETPKRQPWQRYFASTCLGQTATRTEEQLQRDKDTGSSELAKMRSILNQN